MQRSGPSQGVISFAARADHDPSPRREDYALSGGGSALIGPPYAEISSRQRITGGEAGTKADAERGETPRPGAGARTERSVSLQTFN